MKPIMDKSDLILFEYVLKGSLASVMTFTAHSLYFPREIPSGMLRDKTIVPLLEKDRALLPLVYQDRFLGVFMARGTDPEQMQSLSKTLPGIISLCLDKVLLHKQSITDSLTGLYNQERFMLMVHNAVEDILSSLTLGPGASMDNGLSQYSSSFCIMLINLDRFKRINDIFGYTFGNKLLTQMAGSIREELPEQAVAARLEKDTLAVFWPQAASAKCRELAESLLARICTMVFEYPVSGEKISLTAGIGWSLFPQDIKGPQFKKPVPELVHIICQKAREALNIAKENGSGKAYAFGQILSQGGRVLEVLPLSRLIINLGKSMDAAEGQKFMVWSSKFNGHSRVPKTPSQPDLGFYPPIHKGEITIQEVQENMSIAEVLYLNDPAWKIESGDKLSLLTEKESFLEKQGLAKKKVQPRDLLTGLYSYRDFLSLWTGTRTRDDSFCMAMLRLEEMDRHKKGEGIDGENLILKITRIVDKWFTSKPLSGRYSSNCLIFYFSGQDCSELKDQCLGLLEDIRTGMQVSASLGLAAFPCLIYSRTDCLENCRKALEHARLIQHPRLACFDSLTLTVSADTIFAQGDTFAALEEYKQALAADESNTLARNSLAICYARLGRLELARQHFQEITAAEPENLLARYNLGCVCLKQGDDQEAGKMFARCLEIDQDHAFSLFRLGQLAENHGQLDKAGEYYLQAGKTPQGGRLAPRHLARLAWKKGQIQESREHLHQALLENPRDAFSLNLMARICLKSGDDPEIAESLARQSVALRPDVREFWQDLAEIFKAGGKTVQESQARARACNL